MKGRYLIVFLLLGGVVYGLTTVVSSMLAEENPMSASSVSVDWSSVPDVGTSSRVGGSSVSVPMSSRSANRLFHHPAVYAVPQGSAHSGSVSGYAAGGYPAAGGASQGVYLTTSSSLQSYGGGAESGVYTSAGSHSAMSSASSLSGSSMSTPSMSISLSPAVSAFRSVSPSVATAYASADQTLSSRKGAQRRKSNGTTTIDGAWTNWLENEWAGGKDDLTLDELRALYEKMRAEDAQFADTYTWEDFLEWFGYRQQDETFKWHLPIGDGVPFMLIVCAFVCLYKYLTNRKLTKEISK